MTTTINAIPSRSSLTITQPLHETLRFLHNFTRQKKYPPVYAEIVKHLGLSGKSHAKYRVDQLRDLGLVTYKERSPRTIRLTEAGKAYLVRRSGARHDRI